MLPLQRAMQTHTPFSALLSPPRPQPVKFILAAVYLPFFEGRFILKYVQN